MEISGKNVLVTGADGFIGSHLTQRLVELGANVSAFVRYTSTSEIGFIKEFPKEIKDKIKIIYGDVAELETVQKAVEGNDIVFHLAALISVPYSFKHPEEANATNAKGTLNILTACRDHKVERVLVTSSSEVYGTAKYTPIDEEHPLQGQSPYAASKIAGDKYAESFHRTYNLPVTVVRPFNTFGPRQSTRAVIPTIIIQALTKDKIHLGALSPRRDFLFVKDSVEGYIEIARAGENTYGEVINLATGKSHSIEETAKIILKIMGKEELPIETDEERIRPENAEVNELCGSAEKAKKLLGWEPKYSFEDGLKESIDYIKAHREEFSSEYRI